MGKALKYLILGTIAAAGLLALSLFMGAPGGEDQALAQNGAQNGLRGMQSPSSPIRACMNMGGALEAPREGEWGYTVRREDFRRLKQAGFDTVRVPIKFSAHTDVRAPYRISPEFLRRVDQIVDWASLEGLQLIINVHHYEELMKNPDAHEARLEAIWRQLSYHYARAPQSLMFELLNEPNDKMTVARTDALNRRLLKIVRQHNPNRWVIIGSAGWGSLDALMESTPPKGPRIMTTFHYYDPFELTHQGATWMPEDLPLGVSWRGSQAERAALSRDMDQAAQWRDKSGMPILLGEFGVINKADPASRARWAEAVRRAAEARDIGWCYWEWGTGFAAYDLASERWIPEMRKALAQR